MSYLVRRLLENTSNEGFLRAKFAENISAEELLRDPGKLVRPDGASPPGPPISTAQDRHRKNGAFLVSGPADIYQNSPLVNFVYKDSQDKMESALHEVRSRFGEKHPLVIGGGARQIETVRRCVEGAQRLGEADQRNHALL